MPHQQINGFRMHYEQAGAGEQTLLLIHGNVASARWWDRVWQPLAERFTVVRVDLRGCGQSERPEEGNTIEQHSADVRALAEHLGLANVIVVGHSLGGSITMDIAVQDPEWLRGIVLLNSAPAEGFVTPEERAPLLQQMIQDRNLMKMALAAMVPTAATGEYFEQLVDDAMVAGPTMYSHYQSLNHADYREKLAERDIPALILYGQQDSLILLDMMERTQQAIRGSELVTYEDVGHSPNVEAPERFVADVVRFAEHLS
ncbi:MAG TPA: alpha/beta hydrolase [Bacilli bacterium]|nr:alpha/beta hydrolase [Bacilli bacterium]